MSAPIDLPFETLSWIGGLEGHVRMLEQTKLPLVEEQLDVRNLLQMNSSLSLLVSLLLTKQQRFLLRC